MLNYNRKFYEEFGDTSELLRPYPLTIDEIERSKIVAREIIENYTTRSLENRSDISLGNMLRKTSMLYFEIGLCKTAESVVSLLNQINYDTNYSKDDCVFTVESLLVRQDLDKNRDIVGKDCCYIRVPAVLTLDSSYFMAHEVAHVLKEKNPQECRGALTDIEVIPILLELIGAYEDQNDNVFKKRECLMLDIALLFEDLCKDLGKVKQEDSKSYNACFRHCILYLNSFYYSMKLFAIYLENPDFVVRIIDFILTNKISTREIVELYLGDDDCSFDDGLNEFKSRLI